MGASAFITDYRAGQFLPQESHPSQHSWLSSASPTRSMGQARWHRPTSIRLGLWARFGSLLRGKEKTYPRPGASSSPARALTTTGTEHLRAAWQTLLAGASSQWMEKGIAEGLGLALPGCCFRSTVSLHGNGRDKGRVPELSARLSRSGCEIPSPMLTRPGGCKELAQPGPGSALVPPDLSSTWWPWAPACW